jgi:lysozyme
MDHEKLRNELIRDEGWKQLAYQDTVGLWTIGVGHLLGADKRMTVITPDETRALLASDINFAEVMVFNLVSTKNAGPVRERALVNMAFNLGNRLAGFKKFLAAVSAEDWKQAGVEMMDSKWAKQVGERANRLRIMIETGQEA